MKYPNLVRKEFCKTPIKVVIESEDLDEDGMAMTYSYDGYCNYQSKASRVLDEQQRVIELSGKCYFSGDILEELSEIVGGYVIVFGNKRRIYRGNKARNLDGSVNYVCLEII